MQLEAGLKPEDEIDVVVVHSGIAFNIYKFIATLQSICSIRSINIIFRERKLLTPQDEINQFYNVTLNIDTNQTYITIKSDEENFYHEIIQNPFNSVDCSHRDLAYKKPVSRLKLAEIKEEKYQANTLGSVLVERYGSVPASLKNCELLYWSMEKCTEGREFWQSVIMRLELERASLKIKAAIFSILIEYKMNKGEFFYPLDIFHYIPAYRMNLDLCQQIFWHKTANDNFARNRRVRQNKGYHSDLVNIDHATTGFKNKIEEMLKFYLNQPKSCCGLFDFRKNTDIANEMLKLFSENPDMSEMQVKNYLVYQVDRLEKAEIFRQFKFDRPGFEARAINRNGMFFQILLYGIDLCDRAKFLHHAINRASSR